MKTNVNLIDYLSIYLSIYVVLEGRSDLGERKRGEVEGRPFTDLCRTQGKDKKNTMALFVSYVSVV